MDHTIITITEQEAQLILDYLDKPGSSLCCKLQFGRLRLLFLLMYDAGLRVGEAQQLFVMDLYVQDHPVTAISLDASATKTHYERTVPATQRLRDAISEYNLNFWQPNKFLPNDQAFAKAQGSLAITVRQIERSIETISLAAISRKIHPHVLRHSFATRLMRRVPIRVVQQLLGHVSLQSTQVYTHPNDQDLKLAIETLNA